MLGAALCASVHCGASGDETQAHENLVEQFDVFPAARSFERVEELRVIEHVRYVQFVVTVKLDAASSDVADVQSQITSDFARDRKREVLDVGSHIIWIVR